MKKNLSRGLSLICLALLVLGTVSVIGPLGTVPVSAGAATEFSGGDGSSASPYLIASPEELLYLANYVNGDGNTSGVYYKLTSDISLQGIDWPGIGDSSHYFAGIFDGAGHTVSDLELFRDNSFCVGLFGMASEGSEIRNLTLKDSMIVGKDQVGGILGYGENCLLYRCNVVDVNVTATIGFGQYGVGGIAGRICSFDADTQRMTRVYQCTNTFPRGFGIVIGEGTSAGGIVGELYVTETGHAEIEGCENRTWVKSSGSAMGGIVGKITASAREKAQAGTSVVIYKCSNYGGLKGSADAFAQYAGGIAGYVFVDTTANGYSGVDIGLCWNRGDIDLSECDSNRSGGIVGYSYQTDKFIYSVVVRAGYSTADVRLSALTRNGMENNPNLYYYGGIVGSAVGTQIYNLAYLTNDVVSTGIEPYTVEEIGGDGLKKVNAYCNYKMADKDAKLNYNGGQVSLVDFLNNGGDTWTLGDDGWPLIAIDRTPVTCDHAGKTRVGAKAPTCTEDGWNAYEKCDKCGQVFDGDGNPVTGIPTLPATGHTAADPVRENEVPENCTREGGYDTAVYCTVCGAEISREHTSFAVNPDAHEWGDWTMTAAPTDTADGEATRTCKFNPAHVETKPVGKDSAEHYHSLTPVDAVEPTENTDGHTAYYVCSGCDKWFADAAGAEEITDKSSVVLRATGAGEGTTEADSHSPGNGWIYIAVGVAVVAVAVTVIVILAKKAGKKKS